MPVYMLRIYNNSMNTQKKALYIKYQNRGIKEFRRIYQSSWWDLSSKTGGKQDVP